MIGNEHTAQRIINAETHFVEGLMEIANISQSDAFKAMAVLRKCNVLKLDPIGGRYSVKHGAYLAPDVIRRAVEAASTALR